MATTKRSGTFGEGTYRRRFVDDELDALFPPLPAILLDGPKGVGKTATALQRAQTVWRLDSPQHAEIAAANLAGLLEGKTPILLDEWQRHPAVWDAVKRRVDENPATAAFILTGSAPFGGTHSGAARITPIRLRPLSVPERGASTPMVSMGDLFEGAHTVEGTCELTLGDYADLIVTSGFPGLQNASGRALMAQLDGYLDRIVDTDLREIGFGVKRPATLKAWLRAFAAATSTVASWETIRRAATPGHDQQPARSTTIPYVDALSRLRILDDLEAWVPGYGHLGRVSLSPKHHLADPALAARLLDLNKSALLSGSQGGLVIPRDGTFLGALFESLATMSIRTFASAIGAHVNHLRTRDGAHEVDLVVTASDGGVIGIEVKLAETVDDSDVRHLLWLRDAIGDRFVDGVVLTTGSTAYRRRDGIAVVPLGLMGP